MFDTSRRLLSLVMDDDVFNAEPTTSPKADTTAAVIDFVRIGLCIIVSYFRGERASIRGNGGGGTIASGAGGGGAPSRTPLS